MEVFTKESRTVQRQLVPSKCWAKRIVNHFIILVDSDEYLKAALFSEIQVLKSVKSENVVGFFDVMESSQNYYIVQELCDGDLEGLMKKQGGKLPEE